VETKKNMRGAIINSGGGGKYCVGVQHGKIALQVGVCYINCLFFIIIYLGGWGVVHEHTVDKMKKAIVSQQQGITSCKLKSCSRYKGHCIHIARVSFGTSAIL
jgi:hypothetical protein